MMMYRCCTGIILLFLASCSTPKKTIYFNTNTPAASTTNMVESTPRPQLLINNDDIVAINVSSIDPKVSLDQLIGFNSGGIAGNIAALSVTSNQQQGNTSNKGYLVSTEGDIDFPELGKVHIAGLTLNQARDTLIGRLSSYINGPLVEIRIINYKVSMLGEFNKVGPVLAPNHKLNILEAIAAAGDIPITGRKDNVLIIREKDGKQEFGRVNLNSTAVFTSPYYYLQQNDIVYVEPNRIKRQETNEFLRFYLPAIGAFLTSILSVYGILRLTENK